MPYDKAWKVTIETRGQAGTVNYIEGSKSLSFDWEFGGREIIALLWGPAPSDWDNKFPWAAGRREEIMRRVADEVIKQRAQTCWADYNYERTFIRIRKQEMAK